MTGPRFKTSPLTSWRNQSGLDGLSRPIYGMARHAPRVVREIEVDFKTISGTWRSVRAFLVVAALLPLGSSCISNRKAPCVRSSDCANGYCGADGFCETECSRDEDCPCGSRCAIGCGICIRDDGTGPATCEPFDRGLSLAEILGVCRSAGAPQGGSSPEITGPDGGTKLDGGTLMCVLEPVTSTSCALRAQVPEQPATIDAGQTTPNTPDATESLDATGNALVVPVSDAGKTEADAP